MPMPERHYSDREFGIYIDTGNHIVPARRTAELIRGIDQMARRPEYGGRKAIVTVIEVQSGSLFARFNIDRAMAAGSLAFAALQWAQTPGNPVSQSIGRMHVESGATSVTINGSNNQVFVIPPDQIEELYRRNREIDRERRELRRYEGGGFNYLADGARATCGR